MNRLAPRFHGSPGTGGGGLPRGGTGAATPIVYTPESRLRQPGQLLRDMFGDLAASRALAWRLFLRNISASYRQTLLGYAWAILTPLAGVAAFLYLRQSGVISVSNTDVPYALFLLSGLILWQTFTDALNTPLRMVNQSRAMLTRINFPREALILAGVAEVLFNFAIRAILLVPLYFWFQLSPSASVLLVPVGLAVLVCTGLAVGMVLLPLSILYQDVERALAAITPLWMFLTPVFYAPPGDWPGALIMAVNPVSPVLDTVRAWLLADTAPHLQGFAFTGAGAFLLLLTGWTLYRLALPLLIERMSA